MKKGVFAIAAMIFGLAFLQGCAYDKEMPAPLSVCPDTLNISFASRVVPLLQTNCFSCHGNGQHDGNISLDTYDQVKQVALSGRLLGTISHSAGFAPMPRGAGKLSACDIGVVSTWIQEGIKDN